MSKDIVSDEAKEPVREVATQVTEDVHPEFEIRGDGSIAYFSEKAATQTREVGS